MEAPNKESWQPIIDPWPVLCSGGEDELGEYEIYVSVQNGLLILDAAPTAAYYQEEPFHLSIQMPPGYAICRQVRVLSSNHAPGADTTNWYEPV